MFEFLTPFKRKLLFFGSELVIPFFESIGGFFHILGKVLELLELIQCLDTVPSGLRKPFQGVFDSGNRFSLYQEVHLLPLIDNVKGLLLHESEGKKCEEDQLVLFKESSNNPLADGVSDLLAEVIDTMFIVVLHELDGLEEEVLEGVQGVLIHILDEIQLNDQEIEHGTFSGDHSVELSGVVNFNFGDFGLILLEGDIIGGHLGFIQLLDQFFVIQNGGGVGFRKKLQEVLF